MDEPTITDRGEGTGQEATLADEGLARSAVRGGASGVAATQADGGSELTALTRDASPPPPCAAAVEGPEVTLADSARSGPAVGGESGGELGPSGPTVFQEGTPPPRARRAVPLVPGFEVYCELGRGGMGVVYHARRVLLNRPCALKMVLGGEHAADESALRFLAEAESVAQLRHPNIIQIYEIGEHDGRAFLELEYAAGGSLEKQLDGTPWPPRRAATLVVPLARGAAEAHRSGIIHRDIKPGNVLLGADGTPKLADFGLAKLLGSSAGVTRTDSTLGSPSYMAPEQADGHSRDVGPAADVYSLGVILYELLTGRAPFRGATVLQTLEQVKSIEPVSPSRLVPGISRDLVTICLKCLHKEPSRRYATAGDLGDDLDRFLASEPIRGRRLGAAERAWRWCRRKPSQAAAVGLAALGASAVTALSLTLALVEARANARTLAALGAARAESTRLAAERGIALVEQRDGAGGLLWLARALTTGPDDGAGLHHAIRLNMARAAREQVATPRAVLGPAGESRAWAVAFRPDGRAAVVGDRGGTLRLYDGDGGPPLGPPFAAAGPNDVLEALAFSPDGQRLIVATAPDSEGGAAGAPGATRPWDGATGLPLGPAATHPGRALAISPDGETFAALVDKTTVHLRRVATGAAAGKALVHDQEVSAAAFSPDGKRLLTGEARSDLANQSRALLWDVASGGLLWASERHPGWHIYDVAWAPDGKAVATAANDRHVRVFDAANGKALGKPLENPDQVNVVAFSPDGRTIAAGMAVVTAGGTDRAEVRLWDRAAGLPLGPDLPHEGGVMDLAFHPDGGALLSGGSDGVAYLWSLPEGPPAGRPLGKAGGSACLAFAADGSAVFAGGFDEAVTPHDPATGRTAGPTLKADKFVWKIAVSPDGRTVAAGLGLPASTNSDLPGYGEARLWDRATGRPIGTALKHRTDRLRDLTFTPDGKALVTADDNEVRFWDAATGRNLGIDFKPSPRSILALALSPDGRYLAFADSADALRVWDLALMRPAALRNAAHRGSITEIAYSRDGRYLISGSWDKTARVWLASTLAPHGPLLRHDGMVQAVAFSPDGRLVATGGEDQTVRLWDRATGTRIGLPLRPGDGPNALAFSPDGRTLAVATLKDTALWDVPAPAPGGTAALALWAEATTGRALDEEGAVAPLGLTAWRQRRGSPQARLAGATPDDPEDADYRRHEKAADRAGQDRDGFALLWHLGRMVAARPTDGSALARLVEALARAGRASEIAAAVAPALGRIEDGAGLHALGHALDRADQEGLAADAYARAAARENDADELSELATHLAQLDRWGDAETALAKAFAADRTQYVCWNRLAVLQLRRHDLTAYRDACRAGLEAVGPALSAEQVNSAVWPLALGPAAVADYAEAVRRTEAAVAATPRDGRSNVLNTLGGLLLRAGRPAEAVARLTEGVELGHAGGSAHDWAFLALANQQAGHPEEARRWLDKLAQRRPMVDTPSYWDELELETLRRECEALLTAKAG